MRTAIACLLLASCATRVGPATAAGGGGGSGGAGGSAGSGGVFVPAPPQALVASGWVAARKFGTVSGDPIGDSLHQGRFTIPADGENYLGSTWHAASPDDTGKVALDGAALAYVAARFDVAEGERVFAQVDGAYDVWTNAALPEPGDVYGEGRLRVPLAVHPGPNVFIVQASGQRGDAVIRLWKTTQEVVLNDADVTQPDLVDGSADTQWLGLPVLNLGPRPLRAVKAEVVESDLFAPTSLPVTALAPYTTSQVSFELRPKAPWARDGKPATVHLRISSPDLAASYELSHDVPAVHAGDRYRRTRLSAVDGSTQYYAVMPPTSVEPGKKYGLILSLHGAGVEATGQAASYMPKDWAYLIAPTNRAHYGFDWEEWGRIDAIEALDDAEAHFPVDLTRVHVTGHSMGGHGTWQLGVHYTPRFGLVAPSAGWISWDSYASGAGIAGEQPQLARARAFSDTLAYKENLAGHPVFIIHGEADDNVPIAQAETMYEALLPVVSDLHFHRQPGAGHWWDLPETPGVDCVDLADMMEVMKNATVDPMTFELEHRITSPWIDPTFSYVTIRSETSSLSDVVLKLHRDGDTVTVTADNARSLSLDGDFLQRSGVATAVVNGTSLPVQPGPMPVGPQDGKNEKVHGPMNQVFGRPFCFVWDGDGPGLYREWAIRLVSTWNAIGNGAACGLPLSMVTAEVLASRNIVWVGVPRSKVPVPDGYPMSWDDATVHLSGLGFTTALLVSVMPRGDHLDGVVSTTAGSEDLLWAYMPFDATAGIPDFEIIRSTGTGLSRATYGFFGADWKVDSAQTYLAR